ncbi:MAG: putative toxin-antitoxin system toxin component, PIN family [bacterium]|nr:putative toxin-antitoxin system toxin component, PIN family [bacterium]
MRVVLDINVLVSAAITPTPGELARDILDQARAATYTLLVSDFMVWKLASVLSYPRVRVRYPHLTQETVRGYVAETAQLAESVREHTSLTEADGASRDPEDNHILAVAVDGKADYVVTRNTAHFPAEFRGVRVVAPEAFREMLRSRGAEVVVP